MRLRVNSNNGGRTWNTNNGTIYKNGPDPDYYRGGDEIDVLNITKSKIIESKRAFGQTDAVKDRILDIIKKFTLENKLSPYNFGKYPNHVGQLKIDPDDISNNAFYNLDKTQFISKMRTDYFPNVGGAGIDKIKLQGAIKELNVETAPGKSFTILTTEW